MPACHADASLHKYPTWGQGRCCTAPAPATVTIPGTCVSDLYAWVRCYVFNPANGKNFGNSRCSILHTQAATHSLKPVQPFCLKPLQPFSP